MSNERIDLDSLIGAWREAFMAGQAALYAADRDHDMSGTELRRRSLRLSDERAATVRALGALAGDHYARPRLVRLLASPVETKKLLGLPADVQACVFNVDGVLVASATFHAEVWKEMFNRFIASRIERDGVPFATFSRRIDYPTLVHGRSRPDAVRVFLASRGISLAEGLPDDPPDSETVHGLANRKKQMLLTRLEQSGVSAFDGARLYLELAHDAHLRCAVVSGSTNTRFLLQQANLDTLIDVCVDGNTAHSDDLRRKPAPDMHLAACRYLEVDPERTAIFETSQDGVLAGRAGNFELVVAVEQDGDAAALRAHGADRVVTDLGEILEQALAG
jgi:beta-phosphoglucomutase-like phosphatase (HAD superfamily)